MSHTLAAPQTNRWREALARAWQEYAMLDVAADGCRHRFLVRKFAVLAWLVASTAFLLLQPALATLVTQTGLLGAELLIGYLFAWAIPAVTVWLVTREHKSADKHQWVLYQAGAEAIEGQIYAYRVGVGRYRPETTPEIELGTQIEAIHARRKKWIKDASEVESLGDFTKICAIEAVPPVPDDLLRPMTPPEYLSLRLQEQIDDKEREATDLTFRYRVFWFLIFCLGAFGAFLAAIGLDLWIVLTVALSGVLTTWLETQQTQRALVHCNQTRTGLKNVREWWDALLAIEQQDPENARRLVVVTERLLRSVETGWVHEMQEASSLVSRERTEYPALDRSAP